MTNPNGEACSPRQEERFSGSESSELPVRSDLDILLSELGDQRTELEVNLSESAGFLFALGEDLKALLDEAGGDSTASEVVVSCLESLQHEDMAHQKWGHSSGLIALLLIRLAPVRSAHQEQDWVGEYALLLKSAELLTVQLQGIREDLSRANRGLQQGLGSLEGMPGWRGANLERLKTQAALIHTRCTEALAQVSGTLECCIALADVRLPPGTDFTEAIETLDRAADLYTTADERSAHVTVLGSASNLKAPSAAESSGAGSNVFLFDPPKSEPGVLQAPKALRLGFLDQLRSALIEALKAREPIALDLSGVDECDTAGIQLLISASLSARKSGTPLSLANPSSAVLAAQTSIGASLAAD